MRKVKYIIWLVAFIFVFGACSKDDNNNNNKSVSWNKAMIDSITYSNNAEIEMGQLAATVGHDIMVKSFGVLMITDHQKAKLELDSIANKRNITPVTGLKPNDLATKTKLSALTGVAFDTTYINSQISAHLKVFSMFQAFRDSSTDETLKTYVNKYLPAIQMHLNKADSIKTALSDITQK